MPYDPKAMTLQKIARLRKELTKAETAIKAGIIVANAAMDDLEEELNKTEKEKSE